MEKKLYISDGNRKMGYTPENDHDPRYYDPGFEMNDDIEYCQAFVDVVCNKPDTSAIIYDDVFYYIYTENYDVMKFLQDDCGIEPMWFDVCGDDVSTVDELRHAGWTW